MTFVVDLTLCMSPKCQGVIRGRRDILYDSKGHSELCGRFDLVSNPKRSQVIRRRHDLLYGLKVTVTFVVGLTLCMTPKGQVVIRGRRDLMYDSKGHCDLCGRFDLVSDPKRSPGH